MWKHLVIRAESLSGPGLQDPLPVNELNRQRDRLPAHTEFDFTRSESQSGLAVWGDSANGRREQEKSGLKLIVPGFSTWRGYGLTWPAEITGDFDIALNLDVLKLEPSAPDGESTVYIDAGFSDGEQSALNMKCAIDSNGNRQVELQLRRLRPDGQLEYREIFTAAAKQAVQLRIARRGSIAYALYREHHNAPVRILGRVEVGTDPVPAGTLRTLVHTGGSNRETIVRFRSLSIYAEQFGPNLLDASRRR